MYLFCLCFFLKIYMYIYLALFLIAKTWIIFMSIINYKNLLICIIFSTFWKFWLKKESSCFFTKSRELIFCHSWYYLLSLNNLFASNFLENLAKDFLRDAVLCVTAVSIVTSEHETQKLLGITLRIYNHTRLHKRCLKLHTFT